MLGAFCSETTIQNEIEQAIDMTTKPSPPPRIAAPVAKREKTAKNPKGAGRRRGTVNKSNRYKETLSKVTRAMLGEEVDVDGNELGPVYGTTPLEFMLAVMNDRKMPTAFRVGAAKDAAPYVHPKLASVTIKGDPNAPMRNVSLSQKEFEEAALAAASKV